MKYIVPYLIIVLFVTVIPFNLPWTDGAYNRVSGLYVCQTEEICIHEIAHKLDDEAGWISHTDEYYQTVVLFVPGVEKGFLNKNMEEIYATMFQRAGGKPENMPEQFHHFYDFDRAEELMEELR